MPNWIKTLFDNASSAINLRPPAAAVGGGAPGGGASGGGGNLWQNNRAVIIGTAKTIGFFAAGCLVTDRVGLFDGSVLDVAALLGVSAWAGFRTQSFGDFLKNNPRGAAAGAGAYILYNVLNNFILPNLPNFIQAHKPEVDLAALIAGAGITYHYLHDHRAVHAGGKKLAIYAGILGFGLFGAWAANHYGFNHTPGVENLDVSKMKENTFDQWVPAGVAVLATLGLGGLALSVVKRRMALSSFCIAAAAVTGAYLGVQSNLWSPEWFQNVQPSDALRVLADGVTGALIGGVPTYLLARRKLMTLGLVALGVAGVCTVDLTRWGGSLTHSFRTDVVAMWNNSFGALTGKMDRAATPAACQPLGMEQPKIPCMLVATGNGARVYYSLDSAGNFDGKYNTLSPGEKVTYEGMYDRNFVRGRVGRFGDMDVAVPAVQLAPAPGG